MSDRLKSIVFTTVVALVCCLLLTAAASGLKARKARNVALDRERNILKSVALVAADQTVDAARIEQLYKENIRCYAMDKVGDVVTATPEAAGLPVCFYVRQHRPAAYILPVDSRGLWGRIYGYIAIDSDGETVDGFSVYRNSETPGLGAEIEKPWFERNFVGKKIVDSTGKFCSVTIAKGKVADVIAADKQANYVDGISGATLTGRFLSAGLKAVLSAYEPLSRRFRAGAVSLPPGS